MKQLCKVKENSQVNFKLLTSNPVFFSVHPMCFTFPGLAVSKYKIKFCSMPISLLNL